MTELTYQEMPKERILKALKELKSYWHGKKPSKYYFALGHAIRSIEADAILTSAIHSDGLYRCPACGDRILKPGHCHNNYCEKSRR